jgi:hypothetical protein
MPEACSIWGRCNFLQGNGYIVVVNGNHRQDNFKNAKNKIIF